MDNIISLFPDSIRAILPKLNYYAVFAKREDDTKLKTKRVCIAWCSSMQIKGMHNYIKLAVFLNGVK